MLSKIKRFSALTNNRIRYFDVTLRDGLQSHEEIFSQEKKMKLFEKILVQKHPCHIEIGSIVSPKILPQMEGSIDFFKTASLFNNLFSMKHIDLYMVTPTVKSVLAAKENNIYNFSLLTSISNAFQKKNINKTLEETKKELNTMYNIIKENDDYKIKLYISCINECPISGEMNNDIIVEEIMYYYNNFKINNICLSDTCGTLKYSNFKYIIDKLIENDIDMEIITLHLHKNINKKELTDIITYAVMKNILTFDVSLLNLGGCGVTMKNPRSNLTYDELNEIIYS